MSESAAPVGVLGGTFNPIHHGHLRSALELVEQLALAQMRLMPCARPPHREAPSCTAEQRAVMAELAVAREPRLHCDRRELERDGPSYTVDTLCSLRDEFGASRPLCLVLGYDAVAGLDSWHRWQALLDYAHIVVMARPGWNWPVEGAVAEWLAAHRLEDAAGLRQRPAGGVLPVQLRPLAISSTDIRDQLAAGRSPRFLLPEPVLDYIEKHQLYRSPGAPARAR
ncbi:nicotinate-nucleotide adenylyltransferase [Parahaliea maris]|uniref:Probable nicotinate-nucleotide adenylyltransferase n=1 Tax=Parahaliea maris TaxID=2716870 RepID=A0A5C9A7D9_9GAMM|nr:nicotinate-nucleotide adenylyltransferase [Parahaliea maris]TXS96596.1 nicotinate-nucleotide adenylyltransferase [Parahaliea maris]